MGCPCKNNKNTPAPAKKTSVSKQPKSGSNKTKVVVSGNSPAPKVRLQGVCDKMYDELSILDSKTYDLFRRTRFDNNGEDYQWLQVQKQIREWKMKLSIECPDEAQMDIIRELVNTEYEKLF